MEVVNLVVSLVAIALSGVAIVLSLVARKNLEKAQEIMSGVEKQVGDIKASVEGQIKEAWDVGMDKIRGEVKMPEVGEMKKFGEMVKIFKAVGMEQELKDIIKRGLKG